jgi:hypothetical protein
MNNRAVTAAAVPASRYTSLSYTCAPPSPAIEVRETRFDRFDLRVLRILFYNEQFRCQKCQQGYSCVVTTVVQIQLDWGVQRHWYYEIK